MCNLTRIYVLAYAQATSLSRGAEIAQFMLASLLRACAFVRPILQILYKRTKHSIERTTHRLVIACVCFCKTHLANILQNKKHSIERATHRLVIACVCFCKTHLANTLQKNKAFHRESNASSCHLRACVFVRPILQICYKRTQHSIAEHGTMGTENRGFRALFHRESNASSSNPVRVFC